MPVQRAAIPVDEPSYKLAPIDFRPLDAIRVELEFETLDYLHFDVFQASTEAISRIIEECAVAVATRIPVLQVTGRHAIVEVQVVHYGSDLWLKLGILAVPATQMELMLKVVKAAFEALKAVGDVVKDHLGRRKEISKISAATSELEALEVQRARTDILNDLTDRLTGLYQTAALPPDVEKRLTRIYLSQIDRLIGKPSPQTQPVVRSTRVTRYRSEHPFQ